jgi:hypothetical protein
MFDQKLIGFGVLIVVTIALIILITMTISKMYNPVYSGTVIVDSPVEMTEDMTTCSGVLPENGTEHSYSFWCYVTHWEDSASEKFIFRRSHLRNQLNVTIGASHPDLNITLVDEYGVAIVRNDHGADNDSVHRLRNFPLQAWNHVVITVWGKTLDMYLNGKLARTFILAEPLQPLTDGKFILGGTSSEPTFNGFLSRFRYFPRVLSPNEIYKIYLKGPAKSSELSDSPGITKLSLGINVGDGPSCATAD